MKNKVIRLTETQLLHMIQRIIKEDSTLSMTSDDAEPIIAMRINKKDMTSKKMSFYEYEVQDGYLVLFNDEGEVAISFNGEFIDADNDIYVYKPMNGYAKEVFSEII